MTKEALEKEAGESWWNDNNCSGGLSTKKIYICGYLASAEPREKRIAKLEKENADLKEINEGYCRSRDRLASIGLPTFMSCKETVNKLKEAKEIIRNLLRVTYGEGWNYSLDVKVKAEDFLGGEK